MFEINRLVEGKTVSPLFIVRHLCLRMNKARSFNVFVLRQVEEALHELRRQFERAFVGGCTNGADHTEEGSQEGGSQEEDPTEENPTEEDPSDENPSDEDSPGEAPPDEAPQRSISLKAVKIRALHSLLIAQGRSSEAGVQFTSLLSDLFRCTTLGSINETIDRLIGAVATQLEDENGKYAQELESRSDYDFTSGQPSLDGPPLGTTPRGTHFIITGLPLNSKVFEYLKRVNLQIDTIIAFDLKKKEKRQMRQKIYEGVVRRTERGGDAASETGWREDPMYVCSKHYTKELERLRKAKYQVHYLKMGTEMNPNYFANEVRKMLNPYVHSYYDYSEVLRDETLADKLLCSFTNVYCPYVLAKHKWLYKSSKGVKLVYGGKVHHLSNLYNAFQFSQSKESYSGELPVPPLRVLLLTDEGCHFAKEIETIACKLFLQCVDVQKEFTQTFGPACIYILKYVYLFKLTDGKNRKKRNHVLGNFLLGSNWLAKFQEGEIHLNKADVDYLENNISCVNPSEEYSLEEEQQMVDVLFSRVKPFNLVLNVAKIVAMRVVLHERLGKCIIRFSPSGGGLFRAASGAQVRRCLGGRAQRGGQQDGQQGGQGSVHGSISQRASQRGGDFSDGASSQGTPSEGEAAQSDPPSEEDPDAYLQNNPKAEQIKKIFLKKNEKELLNSKYRFLAENVLNSFEKILKCAFRIPEHVIYLKCSLKASWEKAGCFNEGEATRSKGDSQKKETTRGENSKGEKNTQTKHPFAEVEKRLLSKIKKTSKKNQQIVNRLRNNTNVWCIDAGKIHMTKVKASIESKLRGLLQHRNSLFHQLNVKRVDKLWAHFLKKNNYAKLSVFYYYSPVNIDSFVDVDTEYLLLYNSFLFYFKTEEELNMFSKNPICYLKQMKPDPCFVLPFVLVYSDGKMEDLYDELARSTKCAVIHLQSLLSFGSQIGTYKQLMQTNRLTDADIMELLRIRMNQYDVLAHGCILCNLPYSKCQLEHLLKEKKIPHLVFILHRGGRRPPVGSTHSESAASQTVQKNHAGGRRCHPPRTEETFPKYYPFVKYLEQTFKPKYNNVIHVEHTNVWKMKCKLTNEIEETIKNYQRYKRYKYNHKTAYFKGFNLEERENYEQEIKFDHYCLVTYKNKNILQKCNVFDHYTVNHDGCFYLVSTPEEVATFEKNPAEFTAIEEPLATFEKIDQVEENEKIENEGFCLVSLRDQNNFVKGNKQCCIKYQQKLYLFENEEKMEKFVNNHGDYLNNQNIFEIIFEKMKNQNDVTTMVYLKTYLYDILCQALYELGKHRPLYPGLSVKLSAIKFLAFFFYKENKLFSAPLRRSYEQNFRSFLSDCQIPIHIQKLREKFQTSCTSKRQDIRKPTKKWTKRDVEKYEAFVNLYDKILYSQRRARGD
ncbi:hypothetical protein PVNG_06492 [Plasmodium vivax North Korean]|nr:hypothetical protein PVNG_05889 [Plasmodium vivax North Korean]KMZ99881.1 hypothetical protein PVNG_06492 [Plasmodium vivax North Korean]